MVPRSRLLCHLGSCAVRRCMLLMHVTRLLRRCLHSPAALTVAPLLLRQPWAAAVTLLHGRNGLSARQMAVL